MRHVALCIFGPDKPGIVEQLSQLVFAHQGSWSGASLAHLAGRFAGIVDIKIPQEQFMAFEAAIAELDELDIRIASCEPLSDSGPCRYLRLNLIANDRTGIVHELTSTLSGLGINIEELTTGCQPGHNYGELFFAKARLRTPELISVEQVRNSLERRGDDWMLELDDESVI